MQRAAREQAVQIRQPPRPVPEGLSPVGALAGLLRQRELVGQLVRREVSLRHRGSLLGAAWPVLQPLLLLAVYTFVFSVVFGARWPGLYGGEMLGYAVAVFTGLVTFQIFSESVQAAPRLILSNPNFVKRVVFPLEVLPVVKVLAALARAGFGLAVLLIFLVASGHAPGATALMLPAVWAVLAAFALGAVYLLSALAVFLRDLEQVVGLAMTAFFFGSAIFYPLDRVPESAQALLGLLPTTAVVEATRQVLLVGELPAARPMLVAVGVAIATLALGHATFAKCRRAFADVL